ncbi:hypothetical protein [Pseudomonas sp. BIC9C]|uniref:hypothetical protein n=1 Tax=Pseudomonas sp. BIC9C TaxID=3078458 RepID=UPI002AD2A6CE|nr:hypothetical protein [Pseudomonas sp. BIC9C]
MLNRAWSPEAGGPTRSFSRSHFGKHIVLFPSHKNKIQIICESRLEADYCIRLEFDNNVKRYFPQPVTTKFWVTGKVIHYTPDFFVRTHDHTDYFAEVKPSLSYCTSEYLDTLLLFNKLAKKLNYNFVKIEGNLIQQKPMKTTLQTLYFRSLHTHLLEYEYLLQQINQKTSLTLRELLNQPAPPSMRAIAKAIVEGYIRIDLNKTLTLNSTLWFGDHHEC